MERYKIEITQSAEKTLNHLPKEVLKRILEKILELSTNPFPLGCRKLSGGDYTYRIRIGSYRVVYDIHKKIVTIRILKVGHRKDVYR